MRQIARVEQIANANEWRGVTSAGVSASYDAEREEVSDDAPTLAQPAVKVHTARAWIPFSIEVGMDWAGLEREMARLIADAKDELEADRFVKGLGDASNQPEGLLVGATAVVETTAATTLATGDVYALKAALPSRFQPNARFLGHSTNYDRVRRLVGPGSSEPPIWADAPAAILRRPAHESSAYASSLAAGGSILTVGDFSHFMVLDRIGMSVELVPHLFGSNRRPTGQRGIFAFWRSGSECLMWQAFRTLKVKA